MFKSVLSDILSKRLNIDQLQLWILNSMKDPSLELAAGLQITRGTFVCEFLNFLRDEVAWITMKHETCKPNEPGKSPVSSPASSDRGESPGFRKKEQQRGNRNSKGHATIQPTSSPTTPNKWSRVGGQGKPSSLSLGDFIGSDQKQGKAHRAKNKRVTPIKLSGGENSKSPAKVESSVNRSPELVCKSNRGSPEQVPLKVELTNVQLDSSRVTRSEEILLLCDVYSFLLDHNLVISVMKELTFCLMLLLVRTRKYISESANGDSARKKSSSTVLDSLENCTFFSATMLLHQKELLSILDKKTLTMLVENVRLSAFAPDLCTYLLDHEESSAMWISPYISSYVMYQDTDTRAHFQNEHTFNALRKHRDQFYDILALWKRNHNLLGWSFTTELGESVKALLESCDNPLNLFHFARLFRSQLQLSCMNSQNDVVNQQENFRKHLETQKSLSRLDHFSGPEEFFRDFILLATTTSAAFIQHLIDNMIHELVSLNNTTFTATDMSGRDLVDEETREKYKLCVSQTMLLGKFVGFMLYLPYYCSEEIMESIMEPHIQLRTSCVPPIDIMKFLVEALEAQKLVVTLPWVVSYLRMLDQVSFRLPYYLTVFDKLFDIYYNWTQLARSNFPALSVTLVTIVLGSLFEEPSFPRCIYFTWKFGLPSHLKTIRQPMQVDGVADLLDLVDKQVLFLCCPSLWQFHALLDATQRDHTFHCSLGMDKQASLPVAEGLLEQPSDPGSKSHEVNVKLRNSFFSRQPVSTLKTVELVAERVSSSCVKFIENDASSIRQEALELFLDVFASAEVDSMCLAHSSIYLPKLKHIMKQVGQTVSKHMAKNFQIKCMVIAEPFCNSKSQVAVEALIPDTFNGAIIKACSAEVTKESLKRVKRWIHAHICPEMFEAELKAELERRLRQLNNRTVQWKESGVLPDDGRPVKHVDIVWPPHFAVKRMLKMIQSVVELPPSPELVEKVEDLLLMVSYSVKHRQDMIPAVEQLIYAPLSFDLLIHLVARCPKFVDTRLVERFTRLWGLPELTLGGPLDEVKDRLICPRNVHILSQSLQQEEVWQCFAGVLVDLQMQGFLSVESICAQFLSILQVTWTKEIYHKFNICIKTVISLTTDGKTEYYNMMNFMKTYFEEFDVAEYIAGDAFLKTLKHELNC